MGEPAEKNPISDDTMLVQLTVGQIKDIVRAAVTEALERRSGVRTDAPYHDVEEVAREYGVDPRTVRNWIARGAPAYRLGRDYRIKRDEFDAWYREQSTKAVNRAAAPTPESYDRVRKRMRRHGTR